MLAPRHRGLSAGEVLEIGHSSTSGATILSDDAADLGTASPRPQCPEPSSCGVAVANRMCRPLRRVTTQPSAARGAMETWPRQVRLERTERRRIRQPTPLQHRSTTGLGHLPTGPRHRRMRSIPGTRGNWRRTYGRQTGWCNCWGFAGPTRPIPVMPRPVILATGSRRGTSARVPRAPRRDRRRSSRGAGDARRRLASPFRPRAS